jgi:hypothetical protein
LLDTLSGVYARGKQAQAVFEDVRNAFSSVSFSLLITLLEHLHFSPVFIRLFTHVLRFGCFHFPGNEPSFYASSGIRQGCPLSAMLFVLFYELALRCLEPWHPIAFGDDVVAVTQSTSESAAFIQASRMTLQRMGMELNVTKSEVLVVGTPRITQIPIPQSQIASGAWLYQPRPPCGQPAPSIVDAPGPPTLPPSSITSTTMLFSLGHPVTAALTPQRMYDTVMESVQGVFSTFPSRPLPLYARLKVLNHVLVSQVFYRLECIPAVKSCLDHLGVLPRKFLLALTDVPSFLVSKTLFSHRKQGLGALHLPTLVPQRVLDIAHRAIQMFQRAQCPPPCGMGDPMHFCGMCCTGCATTVWAISLLRPISLRTHHIYSLPSIP